MIGNARAGREPRDWTAVKKRARPSAGLINARSMR